MVHMQGCETRRMDRWWWNRRRTCGIQGPMLEYAEESSQLSRYRTTMNRRALLTPPAKPPYAVRDPSYGLTVAPPLPP